MQLSYQTGLREYFKVSIDRAQADIRYPQANALVDGVSRGMPPRRVEFFEDKTSLTSHPKLGGFGFCLQFIHNSNHYYRDDCILGLDLSRNQVSQAEMRFFLPQGRPAGRPGRPEIRFFCSAALHVGYRS